MNIIFYDKHHGAVFMSELRNSIVVAGCCCANVLNSHKTEQMPRSIRSFRGCPDHVFNKYIILKGSPPNDGSATALFDGQTKGNEQLNLVCKHEQLRQL